MGYNNLNLDHAKKHPAIFGLHMGKDTLLPARFSTLKNNR